jgi:hypothetical protein
MTNILGYFSGNLILAIIVPFSGTSIGIGMPSTGLPIIVLLRWQRKELHNNEL